MSIYRLPLFDAGGDGWQGAPYMLHNSSALERRGEGRCPADTRRAASRRQTGSASTTACYEHGGRRLGRLGSDARFTPRLLTEMHALASWCADSELGFEFIDEIGGHFQDLTAPYQDHLCVAQGDVFDHPTANRPSRSRPSADAVPTPAPTPAPTAVPSPAPTVVPPPERRRPCRSRRRLPTASGADCRTASGADAVPTAPCPRPLPTSFRADALPTAAPDARVPDQRAARRRCRRRVPHAPDRAASHARPRRLQRAVFDLALDSIIQNSTFSDAMCAAASSDSVLVSNEVAMPLVIAATSLLGARGECVGARCCV